MFLLAEEAGEEQTVLLKEEDVAWPSRWGLWRGGGVNLFGSHHFFCSRSSPHHLPCASMLDQARTRPTTVWVNCGGVSRQGMHCTRCPCTDSCVQGGLLQSTKRPPNSRDQPRVRTQCLSVLLVGQGHSLRFILLSSNTTQYTIENHSVRLQAGQGKMSKRLVLP